MSVVSIIPLIRVGDRSIDTTHIISHVIQTHKSYLTCGITDVSCDCDHSVWCINTFLCWDCLSDGWSTKSYSVKIYFAPGSLDYKLHKIVTVPCKTYHEAEGIVNKINDSRKPQVEVMF